MADLYINRAAESLIIELSRDFPAVVIVGPRQVGKTSLTLAIRNQIDQLSFYLDLERPTDLATIQNLEAYADANADNLIILDEIQRKPELFPELRSIIDRDRRPGRFILLGSASLDLIRDASESLAGRIAIVELGGLHLRELDGIVEWPTHWLRGGFPKSALASSETASMRWRVNFLQTYFERDLPLLGLPANPLEMRRVLSMVCHLTGQLLNVKSLARSLGIEERVVRRHLTYLEQTFLVRRLPPYFANLGKRLVKHPKLFLRDSGILHALLTIGDYNSLLGHPAIGASWEAYIIEQLVPQLPYGYEAYFYRTHAGAEIDLLITRAGLPWRAVEIKRSVNPKLSRGFRTAIKDLGGIEAFIVCPRREPPVEMEAGITLVGPTFLDRILPMEAR